MDAPTDNTEPKQTEVPGSPEGKRKGIKQIAGGAALAAAGIPMLILPGPGAVAIAGGATMIGKGYTNVTGKDIPPEVKETGEWTVAVGKKAAADLGKVAIKGAATVAATGIVAGQEIGRCLRKHK